MQYLVERYGKDDSLYPKDPQKRAVVNHRLQFDQGTLYARFIAILVSRLATVRSSKNGFAS